MTVMLDVLPLSPERTWATCCSFSFMASALVHGDDGLHGLPGHERGPDADHLAGAILMPDALACHPDPRDRHAVGLAPNLQGFLAGLAAGRDSHRHLVGLSPHAGRRAAMDRVYAHEVDAVFLSLQAHNLEALLQDALRELGAPQ